MPLSFKVFTALCLSAVLAAPAGAELTSRNPYTRLVEVLRTGNWREAEQETRLLLLRSVGREEVGWLDVPAIQKLSCDDVRAVDRVWAAASAERLGFSAQKRLWQEISGEAGPPAAATFNANYDRFVERVGWRFGGEWVQDANLTFTTAAPAGHLSAIGRDGCFITFLTMLSRCGL
ncbi:GUN4 domain-containing protein [Gloeobacter violaceus]|nr:GUN4 domain-containing protein [Gloeobacter violaceus]